MTSVFCACTKFINKQGKQEEQKQQTEGGVHHVQQEVETKMVSPMARQTDRVTIVTETKQSCPTTATPATTTEKGNGKRTG